MALTQFATPLEPVSLAASAPAIRRCTFRRLGRVADDPGSGYEVSCLYPNRRIALPIGDRETSLAVCSSCAATQIFRPDED
jgi:hypothetical protein